MNAQSVVSINDATMFALPVQLVTDETATQLRPDGHCRICGGDEGQALCIAECSYLACQTEYRTATWARCSCCGEVLIAGTPCGAYLTRWCGVIA
jgi:hypothetical protein